MFCNYGLVLQQLERSFEAGVVLRYAYKLILNNSDTMHGLAVLYAQQQDWQQAFPFAQKLVALIPNSPDPKELLKNIENELKS